MSSPRPTAALGNGTSDDDLRRRLPEAGGLRHGAHPAIAAEIEAIEPRAGRGGASLSPDRFRPLGISDPWLGVPVAWSQIAGARAIVESSLPEVSADPSQGSHFFHNITSFRRALLHRAAHRAATPIDWAWLDRQPAVAETELVRHVRLASPLRVKVDGRTGRGVIHHPV